MSAGFTWPRNGRGCRGWLPPRAARAVVAAVLPQVHGGGWIATQIPRHTWPTEAGCAVAGGRCRSRRKAVEAPDRTNSRLRTPHCSSCCTEPVPGFGGRRTRRRRPAPHLTTRTAGPLSARAAGSGWFRSAVRWKAVGDYLSADGRLDRSVRRPGPALLLNARGDRLSRLSAFAAPGAAERAGLGEEISPHTRDTFATHLLDGATSGAELLGHASVTTTCCTRR